MAVNSLSAEEQQLRHTPDASLFTNAVLVDKGGNEVPLDRLLRPFSTTLFVFVRHWGCAACQEYLSVLTERLPLNMLAKYNAQVCVIGHGRYTLIDNYASRLLPFSAFQNILNQYYRAYRDQL